jgi:hypothetical protein
MRNVPVPRVMPQKRKDVAGKGVMRMIILDTLRDSPKTLRELVAYVADRRPEISSDAAYQRTGQALAQMKAQGIVDRSGRLWFTPNAASNPSTSG